MAENFNEYFVKIGPTLAGNIQPIDGDHLAYITNRSADSMFIAPTDEHEIQSIVQNLLSNKSPWYDDVSPRVVKVVIDHPSAPLCNIFNKSLKTGIFPDKLKLAKVIPVFKSENRTLLTNYWPISVLSVFSKILERLMHY